MKTKPVFESFSDFVSNLYEMELRNPGSISALMEAEIQKSLKEGGNSFSLPDLLAIKGTLYNDSFFEEAVKNLQISASSDPSAGEELKKFSKEIKSLSTEEWIASIDEGGNGYFAGGVVKDVKPYVYGDSGSVEVKGAPKLGDFSKIEEGVQNMSYSQMLALVAAYNASVFLKNLEIQKEAVKSKRDVKKIIKGGKFYNKLPLADPKDQLVLQVSEKASQIIVTPFGKLNKDLVNDLNIGETSVSGAANNPYSGQFKYIFPVIKSSKSGKGETLAIETRQKLVSPDKTKPSTEVKDFPLKIQESDPKKSFYVTNEAGLTESGKAVASSLSRMFIKIDKIVVEGSADKRKAGSPWKDNNELAGARRDEMVKYLQELAKDSNSPLSGASIEEGEVKVQPTDGKDEEMATWRAVTLKVTGKVYDDLKTSLDSQKTEDKVITYTEVKKGDVYQFENCIIAYSYDDEELKSDKKQFKDK